MNQKSVCNNKNIDRVVYLLFLLFLKAAKVTFCVYCNKHKVYYPVNKNSFTVFLLISLLFYNDNKIGFQFIFISFPVLLEIL